MAPPIFLVGFPCCGKSVVSRELGHLLSRPVIDMDREIERRVGPLVPFFQQQGESAFRQQEHQLLMELLDQEGLVVATGGGTPMERDHMFLMNERGTTVFIDVPLATLQHRILKKGMDRPMFVGLPEDEVREKVKQMLALRSPVYSTAKLTVAGDVTYMEVALEIADAIERGSF